MLLEEYLDGLKSRGAITSSSSFFDKAWRDGGGSVTLRLVPGTLLGVPADLIAGCSVSKDALHFLNIYRKFKSPASIEEFVAVVDGMAKGGKWATEQADYVKFHLGMYAVSLVSMGLMVARRIEAEDATAPKGKVVFLPVFSTQPGVDKYSALDRLTSYEVVDGKKVVSENYIGLSVYDGFRAGVGTGQGSGEETVGYGF